VSAEIVQGQRIAMSALDTAIGHNRVAHAFLFVGPEGVGKGLAAREFAKTLNCLGGDGAPCGHCSICRRIDHGVHPDVIEIAPADKVRQIKTKVVDSIIETAAGTPLEARRKVFIILDADRLNLAAANKLLKTLEEPPGGSVFILVTSRPDVLPATVVSRCQRLRFSRLPQNVIESILERKHGVSRDDARVAARLSGGRAGRALDLAATDRRQAVLELVDRLIAGDDAVALATEVAGGLRQRRSEVESQAEKRMKEKRREISRQELGALVSVETARAEEQIRAETNEMFEILLSWCRDVVVMNASGDVGLVHNLDRMEQIGTAATRFDSHAIIDCIDNISRAFMLLDANIRLDRILRRVFMPISMVVRSAREVHVQ